MVQARKKKPKRKGNVADVINQILEMADKSSKTRFTPAHIERLYMKGLQAREEREPKLSRTTPKLLVQKPERREDNMLHLDSQMKAPAVDAAVDLAVQLEMAATQGGKRKFQFRDWVSG